MQIHVRTTDTTTEPYIVILVVVDVVSRVDYCVDEGQHKGQVGKRRHSTGRFTVFSSRRIG